MNNFREKTPIKRDAPRSVKKYREFKPDLKEDYYSRCGYCNDLDFWSGGWRFFQLDHFVPKKLLATIAEDDYSNLIYSCFFCNNSKRAKWPTKDEKVHNDGVSGFVHPTEEDYINHLSRDVKGNIVGLTAVGRYMIKAMKLDLKRHAIIWNLERLEMLLDEVEPLFEANHDKIPEALAKRITAIFIAHRKYLKLLRHEANA